MTTSAKSSLLTQLTLLLPVVRRELRTQLRGNVAPVLLSVYTGLLLLTLVWFYRSIVGRLDLGAPLVNAEIGQALFMGLALAAQTLTVFVAPALAVNAISSEYERRTYDMLRATLVSPLHLLLGKLTGALALLLLLLLTTLPLYSVILLFGGVALADIGRVVATVLIAGAAGCVLGLFCSAVTKGTYTATVLCYVLLAALVGGTLFAANLFSMLNSMIAAPAYYVVANPLSAVASALTTTRPVEAVTPGTPGPLAILQLLTSGSTVSVGSERQVLPLYRATWLLYGGVMLVLLWVSVHAVRPAGRLRFQRDDLFFLVVLLLFALLVWLSRAWWLAGLMLPASV